MTFSICVRERYTDSENDDHIRFGVAVTTRRATIGERCPYVNSWGAIATQGATNSYLGQQGIRYLKDGLAVEDALPALLNADSGKENRQVHGIDRNGSFSFSGDESEEWYGGLRGDNFTVCGNFLTGADVIQQVASTYETSSRDLPLAKRLIGTLQAGYEAGGDRRERPIQSAAVRVRTTEEQDVLPFYNDLRVDASESPLDDLGTTFELAAQSYER